MLIDNKKRISLNKEEKKRSGVLWDMHAHLTCLTNEKYNHTDFETLKMLAFEELNYRRSQKIAAFFSCGTPQEWEFLQKIIRDCKGEYTEKEIRLSFGIHPWYSSQYDPKEYTAYLQQCEVVGEIGMDSVWCDMPLACQKKIFETQLQMAADFGKPIILHTKGQEREIAEMIQDFPGKVCVHWYSGDIRLLEGYLQKDCYFTLGPDFAWRAEDELYRYMMQNIPENRMFLETDGLDAVIWAYEEIKDSDRGKGGAGEKSDAANMKYPLWMPHTLTQEYRTVKCAAERDEESGPYMLLSNVLYGSLQKLSLYKKKKLTEIQLLLEQNFFDFTDSAPGQIIHAPCPYHQRLL